MNKRSTASTRSTRKKTGAQLDREIAETLSRSRSGSGVELHLTDASEGSREGFRITMTDKGTTVGQIVVRQHRWLPERPFGVEHIYVTRLRQRLGTKLYEAAGIEACRRGHPFMSDMERSPEADAFWRKQERLGRVERKTAMLMGQEVDYFLMWCPATSFNGD